MNRFAYTAFVAFWAAVATLLAVAFLGGPPPEGRGTGPPTAAAEPGAEAPSGAREPGAPEGGPEAEGPEGKLPRVTLEELTRHDDRASCWKAIRGKVYDVTDFIDLHPTPASVMQEWCGREATEAWEDKGYGEPHSPAAEAMLEDYLVGRLAAPAPGRPEPDP
ncbi:MAG: cytochrome b5 domain-containing protein [Thermoanaerobaculia bacterium]